MTEAGAEPGAGTDPGAETGVGRRTKFYLAYGLMGLAGLVFVSTLFLPLSQGTARLVAALSFGLMSGLWLGHLIYSA